MSEERSQAEPDPRILAELSALADGRLDPRRAAEARELIAGSRELGARYERERRAVLALQRLSAERAPASLRFAVEAHRDAVRRRQARRPGGRLLYGGALTATAAVIAALLILLLPGGSPGAPTVSQAAALALRGSALPPPQPVRDRPVKLAQDVQDVYFPNWSRWSGWRATGRRVDHLGDKLAVTVFYARGGGHIAYTILSSPPLAWPRSQMLRLDGIELERFEAHGRLVVTWRRSGHTCVLSGSGVTTAELARLAGWKAPGLDA
jgi:hypothetical protein